MALYYEPTLSIWAVGRHQRLAARAITHATLCIAEISYDYLCEYPSTPRLLDPSTKVVYRDESRIICDGDQRTCRMAETRWQDLPTSYARGYGDCKCLVAIRLAELWREGREAYPLARCYKCRVAKCRGCQRPIGGGQTWHMQLVHGDGRIEDISRWLGMPPHPDGDDAVVAPNDAVGVVRLRPALRSEDAMNGLNASGLIVAASAAAILTAPLERQLPAWVMSAARGRVSSEAGKPSGICAPTDKNPNPNGGEAKSNQPSASDYPWCVAIRGGDSARNIAERIVGDRARYVEILGANPSLPTATIDGAVDFAPGSLRIGERLRMPVSFAPWISQTGEPRGNLLPWGAS